MRPRLLIPPSVTCVLLHSTQVEALPEPDRRSLPMAYHLLLHKVVVFDGQVRSADLCRGLVTILVPRQREVNDMAEHTCAVCGQHLNSESELREHEKTCKSK